MAGKKKEINKNNVFVSRFIEQHNKKYRTLEDLAKEFCVSRQTVASWMDGKSLPNVDALVRIARFYNVSADYLLGLSDTESVDVNLRAAVEYTGLSEKAAEQLHCGLDIFKCDSVPLSDEMKQKNLRVASSLIQSNAFTNVIHHLSEVAEEAYFERILMILDMQYSECDLPEDATGFRYACQEDRIVVETNLIHVLETKVPHAKESIPERVRAMDDNELAADVMRAWWSAKDATELHQFHAAKALNGYIDELARKSYHKAEQRFEINQND